MTTTTSITAEHLAADLDTDGYDPDVTAALIDSMIDAGLDLDQPDDGWILTADEAETIRAQVAAAHPSAWVVQIDTRSDLRAGADETLLALDAFAEDAADGASTVIDGVTVTADEVDDLTERYLAAVEAAWIAQASTLGYVGRAFDGPASARAREENEGLARMKRLDEDRAFDLVVHAGIEVWDTLPAWPSLASVA